MYDDILVPIDDTASTASILTHLGEIAHGLDASVTLLYVADTARDSVTVVNNTVVDALEREGEEILDQAVETLESLGVETTTDVVQGDPASTIVDYAQRYGFDLVFMPTRGRDGLSRYVLGSVAEKVVRLSSVPVVTVRMQEDEQLSFPYEQILVPTDGSDAATKAAEHALDLAVALDAGVHILSVVDIASLGPDVRSILQEADDEVTDAVESLAATARERGITSVETAVEDGNPADGIRSYIDDHDIDLVVMGTTGRRGVEKILLGSVAETTVRTAPVPVITLGSR